MMMLLLLLLLLADFLIPFGLTGECLLNVLRFIFLGLLQHFHHLRQLVQVVHYGV